MMNLLSDYTHYLLLGSNAMMLCAAAIAVARFERQIRTNQKFWRSPTGSALLEVSETVEPRTAGNNDAVLSGFLERRLAIMHQRLNDVDRKLQEFVPSQPAGTPFSHAARMARSGASIDDLVRTCGLSTQEASLVRKLHSSSQDAVSTSRQE